MGSMGIAENCSGTVMGLPHFYGNSSIAYAWSHPPMPYPIHGEDLHAIDPNSGTDVALGKIWNPGTDFSVDLGGEKIYVLNSTVSPLSFDEITAISLRNATVLWTAKLPVGKHFFGHHTESKKNDFNILV